MSQTPLPPREATADDVGALTAPQRKLWDSLVSEYGEAHRAMLGSFLKSTTWDEDLASEGFEAMQSALQALPPTPSADLVRLLGTREDGTTPRPCIAALEDAHGGIARTKDGMPLVAMFDHMEGSAPDWCAQTWFAVQRLLTHCGPNEFPSVAFVLDLKDATRADNNELDMTFFNFLSAFPRNYRVYVCGAPGSAVMKGFVALVGASKIKISSGYEDLRADIEEDALLARWGGRFDFDLDRYRNWLLATAVAK
jgi:hypothetical protein